MRTTRLIVPAALGVLTVLLAGCGGGAGTQAKSTLTLPPSTSASAAATTTAAGPSKSARGNIVKKLGETGGLTGQNGAELMSFAVDSITPDFPCTQSDPRKPENGHFIAVHMRVSTAANLTDSVSYLTIGENNFDFIGPDGITHDANSAGTLAAFSCIDSKDMFTQDALGNGQQYVGTIVMDEPATTGTLVFKIPGTPGGWEYSF